MRVRLVAAAYDRNSPPPSDREPAIRKLDGEGLGRLNHADKYGISTLAIRLRAVLPDDTQIVRRHFPGYHSHTNCLQMIDKCLSAPASLKFDIFNAISEKKYRWRWTDHSNSVLAWKSIGAAKRAEE